MMLLKKIGFGTFGMVILLFGWYNWASSPNLNSSEYSQVLNFEIIPQKSEDGIYSIVTYNIGYLSGMTNNKPMDRPKEFVQGNLDHVLECFENLNPDIIALQEIDFDSDRSFNVNQQIEISNLGYPFVGQAINWDEKYLPFPYWPPTEHFGKIISGQSVISKYSISNQERIPLKRVKGEPFFRRNLYLDRLAQICKVDLDGDTISIINVHLEAFDAKGRNSQMDSLIVILEKQMEQGPTILLGDFNSDPVSSSAAIHKLLSHEKLGTAAYEPNNLSLTFNSDTPYERLDYIFFTKELIEMVSSKVCYEFEQSSDHIPVQMSFRLKKKVKKPLPKKDKSFCVSLLLSKKS